MLITSTFFFTFCSVFKYIIKVIYQFKNTKVYYGIFGKENAQAIVFLHGWGCSGDIFLPLIENLKNFYQCVVLDFPPFGKSQEPNQVWSLETYTELVISLIQKLNLQNIGIIAHSFGGRVAIKIASCYNDVNKILITGGAGIKPRRNFVIKFKLWYYKIFKKVLNLKNFGSQDYKLLSDKMKKTFVHIVNTKQKNECKKIQAQTLLIYGNKDKETPVYMAKKLNKLIKNSKLILYQNYGHYAFVDNIETFFDDTINFFKNEI